MTKEELELIHDTLKELIPHSHEVATLQIESLKIIRRELKLKTFDFVRNTDVGGNQMED